MTVFVRLVICIAAGWLAGKAVSRFFPASPNIITNKTGVSHPPLEKALPDSAENREALEWRALLDHQKVNRRPIVTAEGLKKRMKDGIPHDPHARLDLLRGLAGLPPEQFPRMLPAISASSSSSLAEAFFAAWALHDPRAALEGLEQMGDLSLPSLDGILKSWAEKDAVGMMEWVRSPDHSGAAKIRAAGRAFARLAESDPRKAMDLASAFAKQDDWNTIFTNWHRRDPEAADQWRAAAPEEQRRAVFDAWVQVRMDKDPAAAWSLALTQHPDPAKIPDLLLSVLRSWPDRTGLDCAALEQVPASIWTPAFATAVGDLLGGTQTPSLEALAARIPDEQVRGAFWTGVLDSFSRLRGHPAYAAAAFEHLPAGVNKRESIAEQITAVWAAEDIAATSAWVLKLPQDAARDRAAASLAAALQKSDPDAAIAWAEDIGDDAMREDTLETLVPSDD